MCKIFLEPILQSAWQGTQHRALILEDALFNMNKAICEAHLLANFHVIRMCKKRKPLNVVSQSFYYKCLKAVIIANGQKIVIREQDLQQSAEMY